jgi:Tol biopolymer transport system component
LTFDAGIPPNYDVGDIYMIDADGSNQINLTKTPEIDERYPDFSPDGSQLCFFNSGYGRPLSSDSGIYVMNIDGSNPSRLIKEGRATQCDWSPDGTKIAFTSIYDSINSTAQVSDEEVYVINADGSGRTNLTTNSVSDLHATWSPDGTRIAFASYMGGVPSPEIYSMDANRSDVARVTTNPNGEDVEPTWQPLPRPPEATPEKQQEEHQRYQQQQPPQQSQQDSKSRSVAVHPPDTGGPSLLLVAGALLFSAAFLFYAAVRP